jgi:transcription initiation factor TFIID TATA-box-binding protein
MVRGQASELEDLKILNVVASTKLDKVIDIEYLSVKLKNVDYDPQIWSGMVWRRDNPKSTIIMFSSGKVTSVGTRSEKEAKIAIEKAVKSIPELADSHYKDPNIVNIVASVNLYKKLNLEFLANKLKRSIYRPDVFPALIIKAETGTFLLFSSGRISFAGGKSEKQVRKSMRDFVSNLEAISTEGG